ncbi:hypothetical protein Tco_0348162 [Tanacetum coccineum]
MLVEMIAERKWFFAAQRAKQIRNKPPTRTQLRNKMITYLKNMGRFTHNQLKNRSLEEIQMLYEKEQKWIDDFVPMDSELEVQRLKRAGQEVLEEPVKRQKIGEASVEEVYVEALQVKYLIIDWEVYSKDTRSFMYYLMDTGIAIHMLIEKIYPFIQEMLSRMLSRRLEVDHECEMAYELLRSLSCGAASFFLIFFDHFHLFANACDAFTFEILEVVAEYLTLGAHELRFQCHVIMLNFEGWKLDGYQADGRSCVVLKMVLVGQVMDLYIAARDAATAPATNNDYLPTHEETLPSEPQGSPPRDS